MTLKKRIDELEKKTGVGEPERKTWVIVNEQPNPSGVKEHDLVIRVSSEEARKQVFRLLAGERPRSKPQ